MRWALAVVVVVGWACDATADRSGLATVVGVVDGDTIEVEIAGRHELVRLIGIDTPETLHPDRPVECHGPEASAFTATLLPLGAQIRLERDLVGRDHFGRLLAYVHLAADHSPTGAELFVNLEIVERRCRSSRTSATPRRSRRRPGEPRRPTSACGRRATG